MKRILTIAAIFCLLIVAGTAVAEYRAGQPTVIVPAANDLMTDGYTVRGQVPDAYTVWSKDGLGFYVFRYYDGAMETHPMYIPDGASMTIPTPSVEDSSGTYLVKFGVAATDTVYFLAWYK